MSGLQEQAVQMISSLSDDNVSFLIEIIQRLMPPDREENLGDSMQAFHRLDVARESIRKYLPKDFDPDKELEEARAERYGSIN